jgi:NAD-dependent deacetylase
MGAEVMSAKREQLRQLIEASEQIVAFTGAGISTESGIPDFRSPGGIWSRMKPIDYSDYVSSVEARRESWRRRLEATEWQQAKPNRGHLALAELHRRGRLHAVVTQNVDGLHQRSGIPDERVVELHGNATYARCLACSKRFELEPLLEEFRRTDEPPSCDACSGIVKSATISFGQPMPLDEMARADEIVATCDLLLVLGTSLAVYPAAGYPLQAKQHGARLAFVNRDPTDQDRFADLIVHDEIGPTLAAAVEL